ncbi:MAG: FG-GAP repeat protein [Thermodesulfobacteriota bacterium]
MRKASKSFHPSSILSKYVNRQSCIISLMVFVSLLISFSISDVFLTRGEKDRGNYSKEDSETHAELINDNQKSGRDVIKTIPNEVMASLAKSLGRDKGLYHIKKSADGDYTAETQLQKISTIFKQDGITVTSRSGKDLSWKWEMKLSRIGYGYELIYFQDAQINASANRVEMHRGDITEWYVNSPIGLEQGFTVDKPLSNNPEGAEFVVEFVVTSKLEPSVHNDGKAIEWRTGDGKRAFTYGNLYAFDSAGKELPSRMTVAGGKLSIRVDDTSAAYPITIDPLFFVELAKLTASDKASGDSLGGTPSGDVSGSSLALNGDTIVVGALYADDPAGCGGAGCTTENSGAAYIYQNTGPFGDWSSFTEMKLTASDKATGDHFGGSVDIDTDTIVVGALHADDPAGCGGAGCEDSGAVYVYHDTSVAGDWSSFTETKLTASEKTSGDNFGVSVAIDGDTIAVGSSGADDPPGCGVGAPCTTVDSGAVYIYHTSIPGDWSSVNVDETKITAPFEASGDHFGDSLDIDGDTIVVGAHKADDPPGCFTNGIPPVGCAANIGAVYIYQDTSVAGDWSSISEKKITSSEPLASFDEFGFSVAIDGDTVVVGQPGDSDKCEEAGAAFIFHDTSVLGNWLFFSTTKITPFDGLPFDHFGLSVGIDGDVIVVGSHAPDIFDPLESNYLDCVSPIIGNSGAGAAYVYNDTSPSGNWSSFDVSKLIGSDTFVNDFFGLSLDVDGAIIVVGSAGANDPPVCGVATPCTSEDSGAAYVFREFDSTLLSIISKLDLFLREIQNAKIPQGCLTCPPIPLLENLTRAQEKIMQVADGATNNLSSLNRLYGAIGDMKGFIGLVEAHSEEIDELNTRGTADSWVSQAEGLIGDLEGIVSSIR